MNLITDYPFTSILTLIGLVIGALLPSGLDVLSNVDYTQATKDPANFLTGYTVLTASAIFVEVISGLIGAMFGALIGILVDFTKSHGGH